MTLNHTELQMSDNKNATEPKVLIGVPVYNGGQTLKRALSSLLNQTYTNFEILISDNASTDDTEEICRAFAKKDARVTYIRQDTNIGAWENFQFTFSKANREYYMWAASDDEWETDFVRSCFEFLENNKDYGIALTEFVLFGERTGRFFEKKIKEKFIELESDDVFERLKYFMMLDQQLGPANFIYGLWRTDLLRSTIKKFIDNARPELFHYLDIGLLLVALSKTKFHLVKGRYFRKGYKPFAPDTTISKLHFLFNTKVPGYLKRASNKNEQVQYEDKWGKIVDEIILVLEHSLSLAGVMNEDYEKLLLQKKADLQTYMKIG